MSNVIESIKQGLNEAIEYEKGNLKNVKVDIICDQDLNEQSVTAEGKTIKTITDYMNDEERVSPADRERINFEVESISAVIEKNSSKDKL